MAIQIEGTLSGRVTVVDTVTQVTTQQQSISGSSGIITKKVSGKELVAAGVAFAIPMAGIGHAKIISIQVRNTTTKAAQTALFTFTDVAGTGGTQDYSDFHMVTQSAETTDKKITGITVTGPSANSVEVTYFVGGDA